MFRCKRLFKYVVAALLLLFANYFIGVADYILAKDIDKEFHYPLDVDLKPLIDSVRSADNPAIEPINLYPYKFLTNSGKCMLDRIDLLVLVKSAMNNSGQRRAIRKTWGREDSVPGKVIKVLFFLGSSESTQSNVQKDVKRELEKFSDIIQMTFLDNYYNNTIKTMMSFRWAYHHCDTAKHYLFSDDDMYISTSNLLDYVDKFKSQEELSNGNFYAGYVFESRPLRHITSKWRVSLDEYEWNKWPPYITAGAYVVSNEAMKNLYAGSLFTKHFRFDDIYLAIVAKKVGIKTTHCPEFFYYKKPYSLEGYRSVIASHGYDDPDELIRVWKEQNALL